MIKILKRYRFSLVVCEIIEEPGGGEESRVVTAAQVEAHIHALDIIRDAGKGDYSKQVLKHATDMLHHYVEKAFIYNSEKI